VDDRGPGRLGAPWIRSCSIRTRAASPRSTRRHTDDRGNARPGGDRTGPNSTPTSRSDPRDTSLVGPATPHSRVGCGDAMWLSRHSCCCRCAAIAWQAAGGGWHAFWLAVTSHAAVTSLEGDTDHFCRGVTVVNVLFGRFDRPLGCWSATTSSANGSSIAIHRSAVRCLPTIVASLGDAGPVWQQQSRGSAPAAHGMVGVCIALAFRHAAVRLCVPC